MPGVPETPVMQPADFESPSTSADVGMLFDMLIGSSHLPDRNRMARRFICNIAAASRHDVVRQATRSLHEEEKSPSSPQEQQRLESFARLLDFDEGGEEGEEGVEGVEEGVEGAEEAEEMEGVGRAALEKELFHVFHQHADVLVERWVPVPGHVSEWVSAVHPLLILAPEKQDRLLFKAFESKKIPFLEKFELWNQFFAIPESPEHEEACWTKFLPAWIFSCQCIEQIQFLLAHPTHTRHVTSQRETWFEWVREASITDNLVWLRDMLFGEHSKNLGEPAELATWWCEQYPHHVSMKESLLQFEAYTILGYYNDDPVLSQWQQIMKNDDAIAMRMLYPTIRSHSWINTEMYSKWLCRYECVNLCYELGMVQWSMKNHIQRVIQHVANRFDNENIQHMQEGERQFFVTGSLPFTVYPLFYLHEHVTWNPMVIIFLMQPLVVSTFNAQHRFNIMAACLSFFAQYKRIVPKDIDMEQRMLNVIVNTAGLRFAAPGKTEPTFETRRTWVVTRFLFWMISAHHLSLFARWVGDPHIEVSSNLIRDMCMFTVHYDVIKFVSFLLDWITTYDIFQPDEHLALINDMTEVVNSPQCVRIIQRHADAFQLAQEEKAERTSETVGETDVEEAEEAEEAEVAEEEDVEGEKAKRELDDAYPNRPVTRGRSRTLKPRARPRIKSRSKSKRRSKYRRVL